MRDSIMDEVKKIVIISDGTGKTAKRLMDAVLAQYTQDEVGFSLKNIYQEVRDRKTLDAILEEIDDEYLVIFSLISRDLCCYCHKRLTDRGILHLNTLEPMLNTMSKFLGVDPDYRPGILQIIDDKYYKKVDAIGYTVEHDDGRGLLTHEADIVLLGLSRTCKTPIAMYLACNSGIKVANIPIVPGPSVEAFLTAKLSALPSTRVFGLMMRPEILAHVREERSQRLTSAAPDMSALRNYYDPDQVRVDLRFCKELFDRKGWRIVNVTRRAIEEISQEIIEKLNGQL